MATIIMGVVELQKEIERLRETDKKLKDKEIYCQKVKEMFLKNTRSRTNTSIEKKPKPSLLKECEGDKKYQDILGLLTDIKKLKRKHLMLRHQLHCEHVKQEVNVMTHLVYKQSELLMYGQTTSHNIQTNDEFTPLSFWYSEMVFNTVHTQDNENEKVNFCKVDKLFYNICYEDEHTSDPCDLLAESISKKKIKLDQRTSTNPLEKLQFSTSYKGFCVQIVVTANYNKRNQDEPVPVNCPKEYQCSSDIQLDQLEEHLLECLLAKKTPKEFVKEYVWKELEKFVTL